MNQFFLDIAILAVPLLLAVTVHEVSHGYAAYYFGDDTAKQAGRLTLNPIKHLDLVGTLVFVVTQMVGWAKPVPVNPHNFKQPRHDMIWVSFAGPASNLILAAVLAVFLRLIMANQNSIPVYLLFPLQAILLRGVIVNVGLAVFNLIPVPPLDGSGILAGLLPLELAIKYEAMRAYGFVVLLILIFTGLVDKIIFPVILNLVSFLVGGI